MRVSAALVKYCLAGPLIYGALGRRHQTHSATFLCFFVDLIFL